MKIILIIFACLLISELQAKRVTKTIKLKDFPKQGPFVFITKMRLGSGNSQVDITYYKGDQIPSESLYNDLAIAMINQTSLRGFSLDRNCLEKETRIFKKEKFYMKQQRTGMKHFKILDLPKAETWYFYMYSCRANTQQLINNNQQIRLDFKVTNNESHFDESDHLLFLYIFLFVIWLAMIIKFAVPVIRLLSLKNPSPVKVLVYGGLMVLGAAYLYRLIHLLIYWSDGAGVHLFEVFYLVLKNIGQAVITTVMVSIAWGWTIVHLKPDPSYIIVGIVSTLINVVGLVLASLTDEHEYLHHIYDTIPGRIVLLLRSVIVLIFWLGVNRSLNNSSGHVSVFLKKFKYLGGMYLLCWPLTVMIVQACLPTEHHRNVITFVQQLVHICGCTLICNMISNEQSAYRKVSLHEDDNPLGMTQYKKR